VSRLRSAVGFIAKIKGTRNNDKETFYHSDFEIIAKNLSTSNKSRKTGD
jgi:hypothetical protein